MKHLSEEEIEEAAAKAALDLFKNRQWAPTELRLPPEFLTMTRQEMLLAIANCNTIRKGTSIEERKDQA